jgi:acyl carrier protein
MTNSQLTTEFRNEVAEEIIAALNLDIAITEIDPEAPLYGDGLGLDSIDILEVALVTSKKYGLQIKADSPDNAKIFKSLNSLCEYIISNRTK